MRTFALICLIVTAAWGCARSAEDRELDRIFAHQARLRDTTGTIEGVVLDAETHRPLGAAMILVGAQLGDISDTLGHFTILYVSKGPVTVKVEQRGYLHAASPTSVILRT